MNRDLKKSILEDLYRYTGKSDLKHFLKAIITIPGFRYLFQLRRCRFFYENKKRIRFFWARFRLRRLSYKFGIQIPYLTKIGRGFYIGHFGGIVINPSVTIGDNVNIAQGVTLGQENRGERRGSPRIGSKVWIGPNSVVVGKIRIGDNVLIGANSFINFDIPDEAVVVGNPSRIISYKGTDGYINRTVEEKQ